MESEYDALARLRANALKRKDLITAAQIRIAMRGLEALRLMEGVLVAIRATPCATTKAPKFMGAEPCGDPECGSCLARKCLEQAKEIRGGRGR